MNAALWNASGLDNLGDRLLDRVNRIELTRRIPGLSCSTFCPWPSGSGVHPLLIKADGSWIGEGQFDAIIIGGGAVLMGPPFRHPGLQAFFLGPYPDAFRDRCRVCWNAVCSDSQYMAPMLPAWRAYVCDAARRISYLTVRNERTRTFLLESGVNRDPLIVPDPAVLVAKAGMPGTPHGKHRIGIVATRRSFPEAFIRMMRDSALSQMEHINPDVVRLHEGADNTDYMESTFLEFVAKAIADTFRHSEIEVASLANMYGDCDSATCLATLFGSRARRVGFTDPGGEDLLAWIRSLDCLIASRLHHCILALVAGTPVVAIDLYQNDIVETTKLREFMAGAQGLEAYTSPSQLMSGTSDLFYMVKAAESRRSVLGDIHESLAAVASQHFDRVADLVQSGSLNAGWD